MCGVLTSATSRMKYGWYLVDLRSITMCIYITDIMDACMIYRYAVCVCVCVVCVFYYHVQIVYIFAFWSYLRWFDRFKHCCQQDAHLKAGWVELYHQLTWCTSTSTTQWYLPIAVGATWTDLLSWMSAFLGCLMWLLLVELGGIADVFALRGMLRTNQQQRRRLLMTKWPDFGYWLF